MVLYNMASFLASFATGFDIRISNLQPHPVQHPRFQMQPFEFDGVHDSPLLRGILPHEKDILNVGNPHLNKLYGLDTYHGETKQKNRAPLNQLAGFHQQSNNIRNNFMQSTTLTTTSGLGSNFTSYTTDPIDSSISSLVSENKIQNNLAYNANIGTSSSFLESDLQPTEEYLYIPENPILMSPQKFLMGTYECESDYFVSNYPRENLNFPQTNINSSFCDSGPNSFIHNDTTQSCFDNYNYGPPQLPPKTPIRTPVMGTKTIHRRTFSNASSCGSNSNRESFQQLDNFGMGIDQQPDELDYRIHNFMTTNNRRELFQYHSVPHSCDIFNTPEIPNRMRLYENVNNIQMSGPSSMPSSSPSSRYIQTTSKEKENPLTNAEKRRMFFNTEIPIPTTAIQGQELSSPRSQFSPNQSITSDGTLSIANNTSTKFSGSTSCTPTHSTPQDSFSDDSSLYLSALSRLRFSPEHFLNETVPVFSPTSRKAVANIQRAMVKRTMELENDENS